MRTTDRRKKPASNEPGTDVVPTSLTSGLSLLHILKEAKGHIDRQPAPPRGVMLRGRHIRTYDFRTASRILEHLIFEQIAWEAVRRGAVDDLSFERLEEEIMAEVFPERLE